MRRAWTSPLDEIWAAVPPDRTSEPVRTFGTFTPDLVALADWLEACGVDTVAMEATGVYWIPVYEVLEAARLAGVRGQRPAYQERAWAQERRSGLPVDSRVCTVSGLLRASFRPDGEIVALRAYLRHRAESDRASGGAYPAHAEGACSR